MHVSTVKQFRAAWQAWTGHRGDGHESAIIRTWMGTAAHREEDTFNSDATADSKPTLPLTYEKWHGALLSESRKRRFEFIAAMSPLLKGAVALADDSVFFDGIRAIYESQEMWP